MEIKDMTREEKARLLAELQAEKEAEATRVKEERAAYKSLKDEALQEMFAELSATSAMLLKSKERAFKRFEAIIAMKDELFKTKSDRLTNTFTSEDGKISITLGSRSYEGWADTVEVGVKKVKDYLRTLAKDENSANLVEAVMRLLSKDRKGNLKAAKVIELEALSKKIGSLELQEAIDIIKDAYRPVPSCTFVSVEYVDEKGVKKSLPLSISAFEV
jgi:hypothetical protein